jgi:uncharacterized protein (DUF1697 family)
MKMTSTRFWHGNFPLEKPILFRYNGKMNRYVAFLRAINVGGHTVQMERLRRLFEVQGFHRVTTFIASGNVLFTCDNHDPENIEDGIEKSLQTELGYPVAVFLRTPEELKAITSYDAFPGSFWDVNQYALSVALLKTWPGDHAREAIEGFKGAVDDFHFNGRELYWLCRVKVNQSGFSGAVLEKTLKMKATIRNITTLRKITALLG